MKHKKIIAVLTVTAVLTAAGILAGCDRSQAGPTLPAKGLFLKCVEYPDMKENHS